MFCFYTSLTISKKSDFTTGHIFDKIQLVDHLVLVFYLQVNVSFPLPVHSSQVPYHKMPFDLDLF